MTKYTEQKDYAKYSSCDESIGGLVCPVGTVMRYTSCGKQMGCVTPKDYEQLEIVDIDVPEGYVKAVHPLTGEFLGALTSSDYKIVLDTINQSTGSSFNAFIKDVALSLQNPYVISDTKANAVANGINIDFAIDRINCNDTIIASLVGNSNITFSGGSTLYSIPNSQSVFNSSLEINAAIPTGTYLMQVVFNGCGLSKTINIEITLS